MVSHLTALCGLCLQGETFKNVLAVRIQTPIIKVKSPSMLIS